MIHLNGKYTVLLRGDTTTLHKGGSNTKPIAYHFERLVMGEPTAFNEELTEKFGIRVELVDDEVEIPIIPQDRFGGVLDAEPTQEMIEAGWQTLPDDLVEQLPVETMEALWRAMWAAR